MPIDEDMDFIIIRPSKKEESKRQQVRLAIARAMGDLEGFKIKAQHIREHLSLESTGRKLRSEMADQLTWYCAIIDVIEKNRRGGGLNQDEEKRKYVTMLYREIKRGS